MFKIFILLLVIFAVSANEQNARYTGCAYGDSIFNDLD